MGVTDGGRKRIFKKIKEAGGRAYLVGGAVRDALMGRDAHDRDYLVCGMTHDEFMKVFPEAQQVGCSFPVFLLEIGGATCEAAFARVERKTGRSYAGFSASCGKGFMFMKLIEYIDTRNNR